jgi:hypothetical protein
MSTHAACAAEVDRMMRQASIVGSNLHGLGSDPQFSVRIERAGATGVDVRPHAKSVVMSS